MNQHIERATEDPQQVPRFEKSIYPELRGLRDEMRLLGLELLIADDNPVNTMLFNSLLGSHSNVTAVDDGEMAFLASQNKKFNIIILDLKMPKLDGLEAATLIRQHSSLNQQTPILLISADMHLSTIDIEQFGIDSCLQKPIDEKVLLTEMLRIANVSKPLVIDWQLCLQKVSGNALLAEEFLAKFIEELQKNREEFLFLFAHKNTRGLADIAHKLKGACCFCGVPLLQRKVIQFEKLALNTNSVETLSHSFSELIKAIDLLITTYRLHFKKKEEKECL